MERAGEQRRLTLNAHLHVDNVGAGPLGVRERDAQLRRRIGGARGMGLHLLVLGCRHRRRAERRGKAHERRIQRVDFGDDS
jgi:hypothetical protein